MNLKYMHILAISAGLFKSASAIDCSAKELKPFNFETIKGIHSISDLKDTPPTQTNMSFYFGICESINDIKECPKNTDICGVTSINIDKDPKNAIVSEIFGFNSNLQKTYAVIDKDGENGIEISYYGANWGDNLIDAKLLFYCDEKEDKDEPNKFQIETWNHESLVASLKTKAACLTSNKDKSDNKKDSKQPSEDNGESWGWFTWTFIFFVLFISIYIIGGAWFQFNKGNAIDFQSALKEVLENFFDLLKGLPSFIREIIEKFTGNSNRGEYSAV